MQLPYIPVLGGANKCNRLLAEGLAKKSHDVQVIVPMTNETNAFASNTFHEQLAAQGIQVNSQPGMERFQLEGVKVYALHDPARVRSHFIEQIKRVEPDWILVSGEEWSQGLLEAALQIAPSRVIYLAHTVLFLPFGPQAFFPSERRTKLVAQAAHIVACGQFVHDYIQQWGGLESTVFHFPAYGSGPFPECGRFDNEFVMLINPSVGKGLDIFLALARTFSNVQFACVPTWGTTKKDRMQIECLSNMTILKPSENIDEIFSQTRILLMPSLWPEGFGLTPVEAMLRGIPVLSSNAGGGPEAKLGTDFVLPVQPIDRFTEELDDRLLPIPHIPTQPQEVITQWVEALRQLLSNQTVYEHHSHTGRAIAHKFISTLSVGPFETLLRNLTVQPVHPSSSIQKKIESSHRSHKWQNKTDFSTRLGQLTPDQQALLFRWLQTAEANQTQIETDDLSDLLKNIDAMSEEEAQALLEKEQQGPSTPTRIPE